MNLLLALILFLNSAAVVARDPVCADPADLMSSTIIGKSFTDICKVMVEADPGCKRLKKEKRLNCSSKAANNIISSEDLLPKIGQCIKGFVIDSIKDLVEFVISVIKLSVKSQITTTAGLIRFFTDAEFRENALKTAESTTGAAWRLGKAFLNSTAMYFVREFPRNLANHPFNPILAVGETLLSPLINFFTKAMQEIVATYVPQYQCMNGKAKLHTICKTFGDFFMPPVFVLSYLKFGVKGLQALKAGSEAAKIRKAELAFAEANEVRDVAQRIERASVVLGSRSSPRSLTQAESRAIIDAHHVGASEGRTIGTYTQRDLRGKTRILRDAGFNRSETRTLMEKRITGYEPRDGQEFQNLLDLDHGTKTPSEVAREQLASDAPVDVIEFKPSQSLITVTDREQARTLFDEQIRRIQENTEISDDGIFLTEESRRWHALQVELNPAPFQARNMRESFRNAFTRKRSPEVISKEIADVEKTAAQLVETIFHKKMAVDSALSETVRIRKSFQERLNELRARGDTSPMVEELDEMIRNLEAAETRLYVDKKLKLDLALKKAQTISGTAGNQKARNLVIQVNRLTQVGDLRQNPSQRILYVQENNLLKQEKLPTDREFPSLSSNWLRDTTVAFEVRKEIALGKLLTEEMTVSRLLTGFTPDEQLSLIRGILKKEDLLSRAFRGKEQLKDFLEVLKAKDITLSAQEKELFERSWEKISFRSIVIQESFNTLRTPDTFYTAFPHIPPRFADPVIARLSRNIYRERAQKLPEFETSLRTKFERSDPDTLKFRPHGNGTEIQLGPVTQLQYRSIMGKEMVGHPDDPIGSINFPEALKFIQRLNEVDPDYFYTFPSSEELKQLGTGARYPTFYSWTSDPMRANGVFGYRGRIESVETAGPVPGSSEGFVQSDDRFPGVGLRLKRERKGSHWPKPVD